MTKPRYDQPTTTTTTIYVRFVNEGFHRWPDASAVAGSQRAYLEDRHRHLFNVEVEALVSHDDRDIEFHDLRDMARTLWPVDGEWGSTSCEAIGRQIGESLRTLGVRVVQVDVSEDGECGARVRWAL